ncbi:small nuclear ribonucleoprotein 35kDa (U11 U12) [Bulinus truncatus]|nr:small nuclear ribonucleoprotein 35kDa (U11 U12) [Bulinus truncatus]
MYHQGPGQDNSVTLFFSSKMEYFTPVFIDVYDPLKAGSIDGTDEFPHDKGIARAMVSTYRPNKYVKGDPDSTVFIGRISPNTTVESIKKTMKQFGTVLQTRIVKDIITGYSKCYAFVEFSDSYQARNAARSGNKILIDDFEVLVELEKERTLKNWIPRRLGGGLGGKRESGQLRFGGKDRPFRRPILRPDVNIEK